jgi:hypothetical protein
VALVEMEMLVEVLAVVPHRVVVVVQVQRVVD